MVKKREQKGNISKESSSTEYITPTEQPTCSNINPINTTTDWFKINVSFKNPTFKVHKFWDWYGRKSEAQNIGCVKI